MNALISFVLWSPLVSIIIISLIITAGVSFLYKKLTNKEEFDRLKEKQKELREKMKEYKNNPEKMAEIQKEMLQSSMASMKLTFKPMMISFIPLMLIIYGLKSLYTNTNIGNIIAWGNCSEGLRCLPVIGDGAGWFLCYIIFSLVFSIVLRKAFKLS